MNFSDPHTTEHEGKYDVKGKLFFRWFPPESSGMILPARLTVVVHGPTNVENTRDTL